MIIRQEDKGDYDEVYALVKEAFSNADHSDGNEHELVNALRKSDAFVPELSLVAEIDGELAGHILFTKVKIGEQEALALAPLAVLPKYQKKGVGTALIKEGHRIARDLGYGCSVVAGSENYYPKFGYEQREAYGIKAPFDLPPENFMVLALLGDLSQYKGVVEYAKEFN